ncbi:MAG: (d)CMP kinase [Candidatus Omnitrophota bacterium]
MIIAIDGPAGAGKSTIAKILADRLGFFYVDTGAMYRALTLKILNCGVGFSSPKKLVEITKNTKIKLIEHKNAKLCIFLDDQDVSVEIRNPAVTKQVFRIARIPQIRQIMVEWQRAYADESDIVMEGRDIGTEVFPETKNKFYLDASADVRAKRRLKELKEKKIDVSYKEILRQIQERDDKDKSRACGPLKQAEDAIYLDTSNLTIHQVIEKIISYLPKEVK